MEDNTLTLNEKEVKDVVGSISEIVNSMTRINGERDLIKEICAELKEKYNIPLPVSRKAATFIMNEEKQGKAEVELSLVDYLVELAKN